MDVGIDEKTLRARGVRLAVLFGSRARGAGSPESDVDIGVLLNAPVPGLTEHSREDIAGAFSAEGEIDLVFLDDADPLMLFEVATGGRPIYQAAAGTFEEFRVRSIKRYYDTDWIRRIEAEALRRRYG